MLHRYLRWAGSFSLSGVLYRTNQLGNNSGWLKKCNVLKFDERHIFNSTGKQVTSTTDTNSKFKWLDDFSENMHETLSKKNFFTGDFRVFCSDFCHKTKLQQYYKKRCDGVHFFSKAHKFAENWTLYRTEQSCFSRIFQKFSVIKVHQIISYQAHF